MFACIVQVLSERTVNYGCNSDLVFEENFVICPLGLSRRFLFCVLDSVAFTPSLFKCLQLSGLESSLTFSKCFAISSSLGTFFWFQNL